MFTKAYKLSIQRRVDRLCDLRDVAAAKCEADWYDRGALRFYTRLQRAIARHAIREEIDQRRSAVASLLTTKE